MEVDRAVQGLGAHEDMIDIIRGVACWVRDLERARTEEKARSRNLVTRDKAAQVIEFDIGAPRPQVWEYYLARIATEMARR
jgi:hypothetical protein